MAKKMYIIIYIFASVCTLLILKNFIVYKKYEKAYELIFLGASKADVINKFGNPSKIDKCRTNPTWDGEYLLISEKCVEDYWYFSKISIEQWVVGFDDKGNVVSKYHFSSP